MGEHDAAVHRERFAGKWTAAGLAIVELREPRAELGQWDRMPLLLWINAVHRP